MPESSFIFFLVIFAVAILSECQDHGGPIIIVLDSYILLFPDDYKLSPAPEFEFADGAEETSPTSSYLFVPRPNIPLIPTKPSRLPVRHPILEPPPPPAHLLASSLLPVLEDNVPLGPPQLKPKPPRPPKIPKPSTQVLPIRPGTDDLLLLPGPPKFRPGDFKDVPDNLEGEFVVSFSPPELIGFLYQVQPVPLYIRRYRYEYPYTS